MKPDTLKAFKIIYPVNWKFGTQPDIKTLGEATLPDNWTDIDANQVCRTAFPTANAFEAFDNLGELVMYSNCV